MSIRTITLSLLMAAVAAAAQAHAHLQGSVPADKSRVKAPAAIELHFSEAAKLTALTLQKGAEAAQPVKPLPTKAAADLSVAVPALAPGDYVASWRVASDDGHVMSGKFGFTVDPAAPAAAAMPMHEGMKMGDHDHMGDKKAGAEDSHKH
jgi:methionine-rich copper-binding protein CopC